MKNLLMTLSGILIFTGCTTSIPQATQYKIVTKVKKMDYSSSGCQDKSLRVREVFTSDSLVSEHMKYIKDTDKELSFTQSKWSVSPSKIITAELLKSVRESKIFASVHNARTRIYTNLTLETDVEEFIQHFIDGDKNSYSKVVMTFTLVDNRTKKILGTKRVISTVKSKTLDAAGGVKALNKAFGEVLEKNNLWLDEVCK